MVASPMDALLSRNIQRHSAPKAPLALRTTEGLRPGFGSHVMGVAPYRLPARPDSLRGSHELQSPQTRPPPNRGGGAGQPRMRGREIMEWSGGGWEIDAGVYVVSTIVSSTSIVTRTEFRRRLDDPLPQPAPNARCVWCRKRRT
jgi:hypothetical protein